MLEVNEENLMEKFDVISLQYDKHIKEIFHTISDILVNLLKDECTKIQKLKWNE